MLTLPESEAVREVKSPKLPPDDDDWADYHGSTEPWDEDAAIRGFKRWRDEILDCPFADENCGGTGYNDDPFEV